MLRDDTFFPGDVLFDFANFGLFLGFLGLSGPSAEVTPATGRAHSELVNEVKLAQKARPQPRRTSEKAAPEHCRSP